MLDVRWKKEDVSCAQGRQIPPSERFSDNAKVRLWQRQLVHFCAMRLEIIAIFAIESFICPFRTSSLAKPALHLADGG